MKDFEIENFIVQWQEFCEYITGKRKEEKSLKMDVMIFSQYQYGDLIEGLNALMLDPPTLYGMPIIAKHLIDKLPKKQDTILIKANQQFGALCNSVHYAGMYASMCFEDPITQKVVRDLGGYKHFCELSDESTEFYQSKFVKLYKEYYETNKNFENDVVENATHRITNDGKILNLKEIKFNPNCITYGAKPATEQQKKEVAEFFGGEKDPMAILDKYLKMMGK